jgi:flagellin-specific chaperone FliS
MDEQVNKLRKGFEALNELLEKERNINETYEYNVKRTLDLHDCSRKYAVEKAQGNITMELALQLAFEQGAKWADKHTRKHYRHETNNL